MQIQVMPTAKDPIYSNGMQIRNTREEFVLDFMKLFPPTGTLNARIITSPGHIKRMIRALEDAVKKYESAFGPIKESEAPGKEIGFNDASQ
jgi:hypothetical protein